VFTDAARLLKIYDPDLIMSWTPNEFKAFCRGTQHAQADEYDRMATGAMFNRYAMNAKRARKKKMFDEKEAHKRIDHQISNWKDSAERPGLTPEMYQRMKKALNRSSFQKKGG
jgi:hypothetical protein